MKASRCAEFHAIALLLTERKNSVFQGACQARWTFYSLKIKPVASRYCMFSSEVEGLAFFSRDGSWLAAVDWALGSRDSEGKPD